MDEYAPTLEKEVESHGAMYWYHQAGFWMDKFMELTARIYEEKAKPAKTQCSPLKGMHEMRKTKPDRD
jgi:hypothetical protein